MSAVLKLKQEKRKFEKVLFFNIVILNFRIKEFS